MTPDPYPGQDLLADVFPGTEDAPMPRWATVIPAGLSSVQLVPDDDGSAEAARWPSIETLAVRGGVL